MALDRLHLRKLRRQARRIRIRRKARIRADLERRVRKMVHLGLRTPSVTDTVLPMVKVDYDGSDLQRLVKRLTRQVCDEFGIPQPWLKCAPR